MDKVVTWPVVALALVTGLPAIIAAVVGLLNRKQLRTKNGRTVAEMVTDVHEVVPSLAPAPETGGDG